MLGKKVIALAAIASTAFAMLAMKLTIGLNNEADLLPFDTTRASTAPAAIGSIALDADANRITDYYAAKKPPVAPIQTAAMESTSRPLSSIGVLSDSHQNLFSAAEKLPSAKSILKIHEKFNSEQQADRLMSEELDGALRAIAQSPDFDVASVSCSISYCQVQSFGFSPLPESDWRRVINDLQGEAIWEKFSEEDSISSEDNGREVIVTYLSRRVAPH